ncbi:succinyl-diaminopimelate desuccinylase [Brevibacillus reuszeri]|uniref:Succinyl-diaminopimelate desuccinylase n=3 Tax=Brevibacillus reuszeri TaxID=54915 RepID=A0A0K9YMY6_9BACL|nr:succinyl-diaminopimelate desuccinylase [Brevibacillus reuszeri]
MTNPRVQKAIEMINEQEAIAFLRELIAINSVNPPGAETAVAEAIQSHLAQAGIRAEVDEVEPGRSNVLAKLKGTAASNEEQRILVFSGHLDTVPTGNIPWQHDPFGGERVGNKLYGRGTTDMKGGVAAMVLAMEYLHRAGIKLQGTLRFAGTLGEEVDCLGAKAVATKRQIDDATAMVISEPSANRPFIAHKGALWLEIVTYGKTAHGSMPDQGINAITAMARYIHELESYSFTYEEHSLLGGPTMNVGVIQGGVKTNVVPDQCTLMLDIRTVPGQVHAAIIDELNELLASVCQPLGACCEIRVTNDLPAVTTAAEHPFIALSQETIKHLWGTEVTVSGVNYYTDGSIYGPHLQVPILICGPGEPTLAHQPDEWIEIDRYLDSIRFYLTLAVAYLGMVDE